MDDIDDDAVVHSRGKRPRVAMQADDDDDDDYGVRSLVRATSIAAAGLHLTTLPLKLQWR
jgi:hypothetical protein